MPVFITNDDFYSDEEDEEFDKLAKSKSSQLGRSANSRATGYDDGEDDLDDNDYRRSKR